MAGISGKGYEAENTMMTFRFSKEEKAKLKRLCEKLDRPISCVIREGVAEMHLIYGDEDDE